MNEEALRTEYLKMYKDVTCFMKHVKISRSKSKESGGSLSYRSIRKAWRKTNNRKKLNREIYHMVRFTIPDYFPELILYNSSTFNKMEVIRYNSSRSVYTENPFTKEFRDIIRRARYNRFHKKNKPISPLDTIKLFKENIVLTLDLPEVSNFREAFSYTDMCYLY